MLESIAPGTRAGRQIPTMQKKGGEPASGVLSGLKSDGTKKSAGKQNGENSKRRYYLMIKSKE